MRINLDEPVPDEPKHPAVEEQPEEPEEDESVGEAGGDDELIIRRDEPWRRRKPRVPKPLTPAQQRALTALLIVVIAAAVISLGFYLQRLRQPPLRLPETHVETRQAQPAARRMPPAQVQRPLRPPVYQGPPPRDSEPLEEPRGTDAEAPAEGIH